MEYHTFWILYAVVFGGSVYTFNAHDCTKLGEITKQETQFVVDTCYVKREDKWVVAK